MINNIARFIATADVPDDIQALGRPLIADCFGCMLAGATGEAATLIRTVQAGLSPGKVPLYGTDIGLTAPAAALANGVAAHAWDLDDWEEPGNTHPTAVILPALLAAAAAEHEEGRPVSGRQMLTAYAIGTELIMRLGEAISMSHYARGFHSTATLGAIGAAAAVARLLGLDPERAGHALGLSVSGASGYTVQFGTHAKSMQAGLAARGGLEAALHARNGVTSNPETLLSDRGFAGLMGVHDRSLQEKTLARLGQPWALQSWGVVIKPWPSCGYTHRIMTAALDLRDKVRDRLDAISAIRVVTIDFHYAILPFHQPGSRLEALFSLPACTAQMLCNGGLTLADSANGFWQDERIRGLVELTSVTAEPARNPDLNYDPDQPDRLSIDLAGGAVVETAIAYPLGAPQRPMTSDQLAAKFHAITGRDAGVYIDLLGFGDSTDICTFFRETAA